MATKTGQIVPNTPNLGRMLEKLFDGEIPGGLDDAVDACQGAIKALSGLALSRRHPYILVEEVVINFAAALEPVEGAEDAGQEAAEGAEDAGQEAAIRQALEARGYHPDALNEDAVFTTAPMSLAETLEYIDENFPGEEEETTKPARPTKGKRCKKTGGTRPSPQRKAANEEITAANKRATQARLEREAAKRAAKQPAKTAKSPAEDGEGSKGVANLFDFSEKVESDPFADWMEEGPSEVEIQLLQKAQAEAQRQAETKRQADEAEAQAEAQAEAKRQTAEVKRQAEAKRLQALVAELYAETKTQLAPSNPEEWMALGASDPRRLGSQDQHRRLREALVGASALRTAEAAHAAMKVLGTKERDLVVEEGGVEQSYPVYIIAAAERRQHRVTEEDLAASARSLGVNERKLRALERQTAPGDDATVSHAEELLSGALGGLQTLRELRSDTVRQLAEVERGLQQRFLEEEASHPVSEFARRRARLAEGIGGEDSPAQLTLDVRAAAAAYVKKHQGGETQRLQEQLSGTDSRIWALRFAIEGGRKVIIKPEKGDESKCLAPASRSLLVEDGTKVQEGDHLMDGITADISGVVKLGPLTSGYEAQIGIARAGLVERHMRQVRALRFAIKGGRKVTVRSEEGISREHLVPTGTVRGDLTVGEGDKVKAGQTLAGDVVAEVSGIVSLGKETEGSQGRHKELLARFEGQAGQDKHINQRLRAWFSRSASWRLADVEKAGVKPADVERAIVILIPEDKTVVITLCGRIKTEELQKLGLTRHQGGKKDGGQTTLIVAPASQEAAMRQTLEASGYRLKGGGRRAQRRGKPNVGSFGEKFGSQLAQLRKQLS